MNLKIVMQTIPTRFHRYATIGDWKIGEIFNTLKFTILASRELGITYSFLIFLHELVESFLCYKHGITDKQVLEWDLAHEGADEPGEVLGAPYFKEHEAASFIEQIMADFLDVKWQDYTDTINKVFEDAQ
jgi:hypothetical protein